VTVFHRFEISSTVKIFLYPRYPGRKKLPYYPVSIQPSKHFLLTNQNDMTRIQDGMILAIAERSRFKKIIFFLFKQGAMHESDAPKPDLGNDHQKSTR